MGGNDTSENTIFLSYKNHQKAHLILAECLPRNSRERIQNLLSAQILSSWVSDDVLINGWSHSEETKAKMKDSAIKKVGKEDYVNGFKNKKHTKRTREMVSKLNSIVEFSVIKQLKGDNLISTYSSLSDVIEKNPNFNKGNISKVLNGKGITSYGYRWIYD